MKGNNLKVLYQNTSLKQEKLKLEREWEKFISGKDEAPIIRPLLYESWQRCMEQGISPHQRNPFTNLGKERLNEYVLSDPIFRAIKPFLNNLKDMYTDSGHLVTFCNSSGEIVYLDGEVSLMLKAEDINFVAGSSWAEKYEGTNAIGMAIDIGSPIEVFAGEHFCKELHNWTCSAAPIIDPATGKIFGVIDFTGIWTANNTYALSVVTSAAQDVTNILGNQLKMEHLKLADYYQSQVISHRAVSFSAVLDRGCRVIKASPVLYEQGLVDPNHFLIGASAQLLSLTEKTYWEYENSKGNWRFELTPYIYGGIPIGAVVLVFPSGTALSGKYSFSDVPNGRISLLSGIKKDLIPESTKKEQPEINSEQLYKSLFEQNPDGVFSYDFKKNLLNANPALERMVGYTMEELQSVPFDALYLPDFIESGLDYLDKTMKGSAQEYELGIRHKNGHRIDIKVNSFPMFIDYEIVGCLGIIKDITENKRIEEALKESEKRLRTLINAMPDVIVFKDGEGRWLEANDYTITLFQFENVPYRGKTDNELAAYNEFHRDTLSWCEKADQETWVNGSLTRSEKEVNICPEGKLIIFDVIKVPIFYPDGRRKGLLTIGRDITELKQTEELLRKSEKLAVVGQLSAGIAHEIRNPLTSLKGFLGLLQSSIDESNKWYLEVMLSEINRIETITNQFMAVAKPQAVTIKFQDLKLLIDNIVAIISPEATMNNIQIFIETEDDIPLIECEVNQIKQVFINILKNAIEAMQSGGIIVVQIKKVDHDYVQIRCIDQGCGIPKERIPYLGEPFYSLKEKGTGLGLMMCYKIIEEHQGKITIESELHKGTTINVLLPIPN